MFKFIFPTFNFNVERWKWNKEYQIYVSNMGRFRDEDKRLIPVKLSQSGYLWVKTNVGRKLAHRVVMLTWEPIPNAEDLTVDHKDHNRRNNAVSNLEWVTREENLLRAEKDFYVDPEKSDQTAYERRLEKEATRVKRQAKMQAKNQSYKIKCTMAGQSTRYFNTPEEAATWLMKQGFWVHDYNSSRYTYEDVVEKIRVKSMSGGRFYCRWTKVAI